jgi:hypothetical protein
MKVFILFVILLPAISVSGQFHKSNTSRPLFIIDSVNVGTDPEGLNPNDIEALTVDKSYKDTANQISGRIYITMKKTRVYHFITVAEVLKNFKVEMKSPAIFMLDDRILTNISAFTIDSSYVQRVVILNASEIDYLKNTLPDLSLIRILTRANESDKKEIRIRGQEMAMASVWNCSLAIHELFPALHADLCSDSSYGRLPHHQLRR